MTPRPPLCLALLAPAAACREVPPPARPDRLARTYEHPAGGDRGGVGRRGGGAVRFTVSRAAGAVLLHDGRYTVLADTAVVRVDDPDGGPAAVSFLVRGDSLVEAGGGAAGFPPAVYVRRRGGP